MFVLVGLGNPGPQYSLNRHNVGFMVVDTIAHSYPFSPFKLKFNALISEGGIGSHKILLCKPTTFMNRSGQAVGPLINFYKIPPNNVYVVHDDLDLDLGRLKLKQGGGSGGHNGLKSLDQSIGKEYWRLRIGISHPGHALAVSNYVLSDFSKNEQKALVPILTTLAELAPDLFGNEPGLWLNTYQQRLSCHSSVSRNPETPGIRGGDKR